MDEWISKMWYILAGTQLVIEYLPNMHKALYLTFSTEKM
jgi:hypothetical protein